MRLFEIMELAKRYVVLAIICAALLSALFSIGYFMIYQKMMKGTKRLSKKKCIISVILLCYFVFVACAVFLSRGSYYIYGNYNLHPFSSYREAWNSFSINEWRNIILNIILFLPLGILLPIYSKQFQSYKTILFGFGLTLTIEMIQYITKRGICEIDDIINNTLGTMIGYGLIMTFFVLFHKTKQRRIRILGYLFPLLATVAVFTSIFIVYQNQEFGNLPSTYAFRTNMKGIDLQLETELSTENPTATIYQATLADRGEADKFARQYFQQLGMSINEERTDAYQDSALFYNNEGSLHLWIEYAGLTYRLTDFTRFDDGIEEAEADEAVIREILQKTYSINIPEEAIFISEGEGRYGFSVNMIQQGNDLLNGTIQCTYYNDGTIKELNYGVIEYQPLREQEIITEKEAYEYLQKGKFKSYLGMERLQSISVKGVSLQYEIDTKGYYQPVYQFVAKINEFDYDTNITIAALR